MGGKVFSESIRFINTASNLSYVTLTTVHTQLSLSAELCMMYFQSIASEGQLSVGVKLYDVSLNEFKPYNQTINLVLCKIK